MKQITLLAGIIVSMFMASTLFASDVKEFEINGVKLGMSKEAAFEALDSVYGKEKGYKRFDNVTSFGYDNSYEAVTVFMGAFFGEYKAKKVTNIVKKLSGDAYDKAKIIEQINSKYGMPDGSVEFEGNYSSRWCGVDHGKVKCKDSRAYFMLLEASNSQAQLMLQDLSEYYSQ